MPKPRNKDDNVASAASDASDLLSFGAVTSYIQNPAVVTIPDVRSSTARDGYKAVGSGVPSGVVLISNIQRVTLDVVQTPRTSSQNETPTKDRVRPGFKSQTFSQTVFAIRTLEERKAEKILCNLKYAPAHPAAVPLACKAAVESDKTRAQSRSADNYALQAQCGPNVTALASR